MGTLFVDNIKHESAQGSGTITLGASGETVALASGASVGAGMGKVLQIQYGIRDTEFSTTSNGYVDVSNMTFTLTPKSTSSKILVFAFGRSGAAAGNNEIRWRILRDSTTVNAGRDMYSVCLRLLWEQLAHCLQELSTRFQPRVSLWESLLCRIHFLHFSRLR